jgi:uncharacterized low-complexity protein
MNTSRKTLSLALAASLGGAVALAADAVFAAQPLEQGYMVAQAGKMPMGKCGGGMCGGNMQSKMNSGASGPGSCSIEKMDGNGDGKIDRAEFVKYHEAMFDKIDANKDGTIDKDEMAKWHSGACGMNKPRAGKCGSGKCGGMK